LPVVFGLLPGFFHGDSGDEEEETSDSEVANESEKGDGEGDNADAEPEDGFSEVVGVTGIFPEASGVDNVLSLFFVFEEVYYLSICNGFICQSDECDT
jgi:hypothetical protein